MRNETQKPKPRICIKPFVVCSGSFHALTSQTKTALSFGLKNRGAVLFFIGIIQMVFVTLISQLLPTGINWYIGLFANGIGFVAGTFLCAAKNRSL